MNVKFKITNLELFKNKCLMLCEKLKFGIKMPYLGIFGNKSEKDIAIFAISAVKVESFVQNLRNFSLEPKLPSLD